METILGDERNRGSWGKKGFGFGGWLRSHGIYPAIEILVVVWVLLGLLQAKDLDVSYRLNFSNIFT